MDDIVDSFTQKIIIRLKERLADSFKMFDIEFGLPLQLNAGQCKKMLGIKNNDEFQRIVTMDNFPKVDKGKGTQIRYPRDAVRDWYNENWRNIA